jgi:hypothetical protein
MNSGELQALWRSLVRLYPAWTIMLDFFFNPSTYRLWGVDLLRGPMLDRKSKKVAAALAGVSSPNANTIAKLAAMNVQRASNLFTAIGITYVSLPLALGALVSDIAPEAARTFITENISFVVPFVVGLAFARISYFFSMWRARQLLWAIELAISGVLTK